MSVIPKQHSTSCTDHRYAGGTGCICRPSADKAPPQTYELWWCKWCGEHSWEDSDPCQRCGEPIVRATYTLTPGAGPRATTEQGATSQ